MSFVTGIAVLALIVVAAAFLAVWPYIVVGACLLWLLYLHRWKLASALALAIILLGWGYPTLAGYWATVAYIDESTDQMMRPIPTDISLVEIRGEAWCSWQCIGFLSLPSKPFVRVAGQRTATYRQTDCALRENGSLDPKQRYYSRRPDRCLTEVEAQRGSADLTVASYTQDVDVDRLESLFMHTARREILEIRGPSGEILRRSISTTVSTPSAPLMLKGIKPDCVWEYCRDAVVEMTVVRTPKLKLPWDPYALSPANRNPKTAP